jgi:hypothetical protein
MNMAIQVFNIVVQNTNNKTAVWQVYQIEF